MISFQVEYEPKSVTASNYIVRGNYQNQVTTVASSTSSSGVTSTFVPFPNYRNHFSSNDVLSSSQSIPVCYGSPYSTHFESSYGVMSLSAFNEIYKTTNTSTHFQPLRTDDTEFSYAAEIQSNLKLKSADIIRGDSPLSLENINQGRPPVISEGISHSSVMPFDPFSSRHTYSDSNRSFLDREDLLSPKKYSGSAQLPALPPLIKSPTPIATFSSFDHSNISNNFTDKSKSLIKSQGESDLFTFQNSERPFDR